MATDLTPAEERPPATDAPLVRAEPPLPGAARSAVYSGRFGIAYAVLAAFVGLAVGGFVVLAGRGDDSVSRWSAWQPAGRGIEAPRQIAEFVGERYRLPSGAQLVGVVPVAPAAVQNIPVRAYAIRNSFVEGDIDVFEADGSVMYSLCGFGQRCSITEGQPSIERARLLHQQALELALYTFRYVDDVNSVVALLPPRANSQTTFAAFFRESELDDVLDRPLRTTIRESGQLSAERLTRSELERIARLTQNNVFQYQIQQLQDGSPALIFSPPTA